MSLITNADRSMLVILKSPCVQFICSYKSNIANLKEAMIEFDAKAEIQHSQMDNDNVIKAKKKFRKVRDDFNNVIHELYPHYKTFLTSFMEVMLQQFQQYKK